MLLATKQRKVGTEKRSLTAAYFLCFALVGLLSATLGPSLPTIAKTAGQPPTALALLFTADAFGSVCGSLLAGPLFNRITPHIQAIFGLVGISLLTATLPLFSDRWLLVPAWWALGMSKTFLIVTVNTLLLSVRRAAVSTFISTADFILGLGSLLMPIVIAQSITRTGELHWAYWAVCAVALGLIVCFYVLPSPPVVQNRPEDQAASTGRWLVPGVAVLLFFYVGAEVSFSGWLPSYVLNRSIAHSTAAAAYYASLFWIAVTAGRLLWLPISKRLRPEITLTGSVTACCLILGSILLFASSSVTIAIGVMMFGLAMSLIFPTAFTLLAQRQSMSGMVSAVCLCTASVGAMFFPWWISHFLPLSNH